ncbi:unnamed protein product [Phytomonas sp. Hart1]|nr:unnamed protein product [Phytomonas sp. Hart1]|eukprot:CCW70189.1 unnamed protein product [Phytomonas sp. isolate Hart1]
MSNPVSADTGAKGWEIIERVTPFVHAVGRVEGPQGRGSAIFVSLSAPVPSVSPLEGEDSLAVLLSTSEVLPGSPGALAGMFVAFMEQPIVGTAAALGRKPIPFFLALRGDAGLVSSVEAPLPKEPVSDKTAVEEVGFTLTYCETTHQCGSFKGGDGLHQIRPLPLPLRPSMISPVQIGDTHLLVTHVDGLERRYVVRSVVAVFEDYCEYAQDSGRRRLGEFSSGGAVFNERGDFIGLQHYRNHSICMFATSIVRYLFYSGHLAMCQFPILEPSLTEKTLDGGDLQALTPTKITLAPLTAQIPSYLEVYNEFMTGYDSFLHMLSAFGYSPMLTQKVLETMVSPSYECELRIVAATQVVGVILGIVDTYPHLESLVNIALIVLSRLCMHNSNLYVFIHAEGISTVTEVLKMYLHQPRVLQWGVYCLHRVVDEKIPLEYRAASVDLILRCSFLDFAMHTLQTHGRTESTHTHLVRWISLLLANLIEVQPYVVTWLAEKDYMPLWVDIMKTYLKEEVVIQALLLVLQKILRAASALHETSLGIGNSDSSTEEKKSKKEHEDFSNEILLEKTTESVPSSRGADSCTIGSFPSQNEAAAPDISQNIAEANAFGVSALLLYTSLSRPSCRDAFLNILVCVLEREADGVFNCIELNCVGIVLEVFEYLRVLGLLTPRNNHSTESPRTFGNVIERLDKALIQLQKKFPSNDALLKSIECARSRIGV